MLWKLVKCQTHSRDSDVTLRWKNLRRDSGPQRGSLIALYRAKNNIPWMPRWWGCLIYCKEEKNKEKVTWLLFLLKAKICENSGLNNLYLENTHFATLQNLIHVTLNSSLEYMCVHVTSTFTVILWPLWCMCGLDLPFRRNHTSQEYGYFDHNLGYWHLRDARFTPLWSDKYCESIQVLT